MRHRPRHLHPRDVRTPGAPPKYAPAKFATAVVRTFIVHDRQALPVRRSIAFPLVALLLAPTAAAFDSVPPGSSVHDAITADAARSLQFPAAAVDALQQATRRPDYDEGAITLAANGSVLVTANGYYVPAHHCDRVPPTSDADAFRATTAYISSQRVQAIAASRSGHPDDAMMALGRGLHAVQDCFAHSNIADLGPQQTTYVWAVSRDGQATPELRLTGFDPKAPTPEFPPGDPYPYGHYNLDAPNATLESRLVLADAGTKFEHARQDAIAASRVYMQSVLGNLTPEQRGALDGTHPQAPPHHLPIPAPAPIVVAAVIGFAAAVARRKRTQP